MTINTAPTIATVAIPTIKPIDKPVSAHLPPLLKLAPLRLHLRNALAQLQRKRDVFTVAQVREIGQNKKTTKIKLKEQNI